MTQIKKIIGLMFKQGHALKTENTFFEEIVLSKSTIYFQINLYKLVNKHSHLRWSTLFARY